MTAAGRDAGRHAVSVILSSYNQSNALRPALAGLRAQDDLDFELLIADDGSQADARLRPSLRTCAGPATTYPTAHSSR